ncbi:MAG: ECF transporter S component [Spirochaetota bacterium]|jgi:hypothetical protein|nr:ECF transporter S component [Spirochaetota bacterium]
MTTGTGVLNRAGIKTQSLTIGTAVAAAVILPQVFHALGIISGTGSAPGQVFLPMYLPIILAGFFAGAIAGALSGLLAPVVSFALSGMPLPAMVSFISIELAVIGLAAGMLCNLRLPAIGKVILAQLLGKAALALSILAAVFVFDSETITTGYILASIRTGLPGWVLQWALIPLIIFRVENRNNLEE